MVTKEKIMTQEEIMDLIPLAQQGDEEAVETLVTRNQRLIWKVVHKFRNSGFEPEELFQVGAIGLIKSIQKFDMGFGVQFSTYAIPMIQGEIQRFRRDDGIIRISREIKDVMYKIRRNELNGSTPEHISEVLEVPDINKVKAALHIIRCYAVLSLDDVAYRNGEADDITYGDRIEADINGDNWIEHIALREALQKLAERDRQILTLRFLKERTQTEVAKILGVTQVQVSRLENKAVLKLKKLIEEDNDMTKSSSSSTDKQAVKVTVTAAKQTPKAETKKVESPASKRGKFTRVAGGKGDKTEAIRLLKETTLTQKEIAEKTGVPEGSVAGLAVKHRSREVSAVNMRSTLRDTTTVLPAALTSDTAEEIKEQMMGEFIRATPVSVIDEEVTKNGFNNVGIPVALEDIKEAHMYKPEPAHLQGQGVVTLGFNFNTEVSGDEISKEEAIKTLRKTVDVVKALPVDSMSFELKIRS